MGPAVAEAVAPSDAAAAGPIAARMAAPSPGSPTPGSSTAQSAERFVRASGAEVVVWTWAVLARPYGGERSRIEAVRWAAPPWAARTAGRRAVPMRGVVRRAAPTAAHTVASSAARRAVPMRAVARPAVPTAAGRAARTPATTTAGRTAVPMRAVVRRAGPIEGPEYPNASPAALCPGPHGPGRCGADGRYRGGHRRSSTSIRCRHPSPGRSRLSSEPTSNGRSPVGSRRISGCPGRVRAARPGTRTMCWFHRVTIDAVKIARMLIDLDRVPASAAPPIAAGATAVRRTNERLPVIRCATRRHCGARLTRSPLNPHCREWPVAERSHTNTLRYHLQPTTSRVHPAGTGNPPYGCGRHGRATDTTRVPLGREDLIGHSSVPDGRPHPIRTADFKPDMSAFVTGRPLWTVRSLRMPCARRRCPTSAWRVWPRPAAPADRDTAAEVPRQRARSVRPCGLRHAAPPWRHA